MRDYYIGLISGTSMDGIDAALVEFSASSLEVVGTREHQYPQELAERLGAAVRAPARCTVDDVGSLDRWIGELFADAANALLADVGLEASAVIAIGSHGQTLRHRPDAAHPFSLQIGDPTVIAASTGITTVADFRRADMALGGQGAPLAPAFHEWLFRCEDQGRVVLNLGGIANITLLSPNQPTATGFDTGPANTLLDAWIRKHRGEPFDIGGDWAASGKVHEGLLARLLDDPYFSAPPPKSTGFEYFNLGWLESADTHTIDPADVQATLCELTAATVADAVQKASKDVQQVLVCGGGLHNRDLMRRLAAKLPDIQFESTAVAGLDPDWVEAAAFAWLAMRRTQGLTGNLPSVTGASGPAVLGAIHSAG